MWLQNWGTFEERMTKLKRHLKQRVFNIACLCLCACTLDGHGILSGLSWDSGEQNFSQQLPQQGLKKKAHKTGIFSPSEALQLVAHFAFLCFWTKPIEPLSPEMQSMHALLVDGGRGERSKTKVTLIWISFEALSKCGLGLTVIRWSYWSYSCKLCSTRGFRFITQFKKYKLNVIRCTIWSAEEQQMRQFDTKLFIIISPKLSTVTQFQQLLLCWIWVSMHFLRVEYSPFIFAQIHPQHKNPNR